MIAFKKLMLTTDLSSNAEAAAAHAAELARRFEGQIDLVHVFEDAVYYLNAAAAEGIVLNSADWLEASRADRLKKLQAAADEIAKKEKVRVNPVLLEGHAVHEIIAYIKEAKVDCLVAATHGRTGLSHLVMGSVAERLVRMSPCPVLTIRPAQIVAGKHA